MPEKFSVLYNQLTPESKNWVEHQVEQAVKKMALRKIHDAIRVISPPMVNTHGASQHDISQGEKRADIVARQSSC